MSTSITPPPHSCQAPEGSITNHTPTPSTLALLHTLQSAYNQARRHGLCPSAAAHLASAPSPFPTAPYTPPAHPAPHPHAPCPCPCRYQPPPPLQPQPRPQPQPQQQPPQQPQPQPPQQQQPQPQKEQQQQQQQQQPHPPAHSHSTASSSASDSTTTTTTAPACAAHPAHPSSAVAAQAPHQAPDLRSTLAHLSAPHAKIAACRNQFLASYQRAKAAKLHAALRTLFSTQYDRLYRPPGCERPDSEARLLGCKHYARNCKLKAKCCGVFVSCRFCHDEAMGDDHDVDRFATDEVLCMLCLTEQPVADRCVSCGERFAHWFCAECKFYENTPGKKVYHCGRCKICRLGEGLGIDNYHCDNCDACVSVSSREHHRCMSKALHTNCPVCRGYLFTSTEPVFFMRCGHTMHKRCFEIYTRDRYQCPLCMRSLKNMTPVFRQIDEQLRREPMPPEYANKRSLILCNDCGARSWVKYHFTYHKCPAKECDGSYNTVQLKVADVEGGMSADAGASPPGGSRVGGAGGDAAAEDGQRAKSSVPWRERG